MVIQKALSEWEKRGSWKKLPYIIISNGIRIIKRWDRHAETRTAVTHTTSQNLWTSDAYTHTHTCERHTNNGWLPSRKAFCFSFKAVITHLLSAPTCRICFFPIWKLFPSINCLAFDLNCFFSSAFASLSCLPGNCYCIDFSMYAKIVTFLFVLLFFCIYFPYFCLIVPTWIVLDKNYHHYYF